MRALSVSKVKQSQNSTMRTFKATGIVIKRKNIGEADRILTIFTKDQGKLQIKAKGVRRITSKRSSHVEPLNYCSFGLYKGQGMSVLTEIETVASFQPIKADLQKTGFAYHICELIDGLCPEEQENQQVFFLLLETLKKLSSVSDSAVIPGAMILHDENSSSDNIVTIIHEFEVELLSLLGYWSSDEIFSSQQFERIVEGILERKLKALQIIPQLQS